MKIARTTCETENRLLLSFVSFFFLFLLLLTFRCLRASVCWCSDVYARRRCRLESSALHQSAHFLVVCCFKCHSKCARHGKKAEKPLKVSFDGRLVCVCPRRFFFAFVLHKRVTQKRLAIFRWMLKRKSSDNDNDTRTHTHGKQERTVSNFLLFHSDVARLTAPQQRIHFQFIIIFHWRTLSHPLSLSHTKND